MSEVTLTGYVAAKGDDPNAVPMEPTAKTKGSCGLYIAFQYPNRNDDLDPQGLPQPIIPPMEIQYVETRYTFDDRAGVDWEDENIVWTYHQKVAPLGPSTYLPDPNNDYDPDTNDYVGFTSQVTIRPITIKENIYFQMRCVSRSGVPSDWTDIVKITMNDDPDSDENSSNSLNNLPCGHDSVLFIPGNNI